jgi:glucokinase
MSASIGIVAAEGISAALVAGNSIDGPVQMYPADGGIAEDLPSLPADGVAEKICGMINQTAGHRRISCVGVAFPGVIRNGIVEEAPNYPQMKGFRLGETVRGFLEANGHHGVQVGISNDADVVASGVAAQRNQLDRLVRVWTLGNGIGYGRYPSGEEVWEGGHTVVSLDPKEKYCGCGGIGHLEGIMGYRSMRLRFLDLEPEEIFEQANDGEPRCTEFVRLWHRALAAATASSLHMEGPGKFYLTGPSARYINLSLLHQYMHEMVKMSALQGYLFEVVPGGHEIGIVGAVVNARMAVSAAIYATAM